MNLMVLRRNYLLWKGRAFIAMHNIWTLISIFILGATSKSGDWFTPQKVGGGGGDGAETHFLIRKLPLFVFASI